MASAAADSLVVQFCLNTNRSSTKLCKLSIDTSIPNEKFYKSVVQTAKQKLRAKPKKKTIPLRLFLVQTGQEINAENIRSLLNAEFANYFTQTLCIALSVGEEFQGRILEPDAIKPNRCILRVITAATDVSSEAGKQLEQCQRLRGMKLVVGQPDLHAGKGYPIGVSLVSQQLVYPALIGTDIGCGMALLQTAIPAQHATTQRVNKWVRDLQLDEPYWTPWKMVNADDDDTNEDTNSAKAQMTAFLREPTKQWPTGTDYDGVDVTAVTANGLDIHDYSKNLGTIGSGNHFAELLQIDQVIDETLFKEMGCDRDRLWLMVHSGSRGFGAAILDDYLKTHSANAGLDVDTEDFRRYMQLHDNALKWAKKNRMVIAQRFLNCLGTGNMYALSESTCHLDIFHNYLCSKALAHFPELIALSEADNATGNATENAPTADKTCASDTQQKKQTDDGGDDTESPQTSQSSQKQHRSYQKHKNTALEFLQVDGGHKIALSHAPTAQQLRHWREEYGITDVVSLTRLDEPKAAGIKQVCDELQPQIAWHHHAISGARKLCSAVTATGFETAFESNQDMHNLLQVQTIVDLLRSSDDTHQSPAQHVVLIHCAAGQHRTGLYAYILLRRLGHTKEETMAKLAQIRPVTSREMVLRRKPNTWFHDERIKTLVDFAEQLMVVYQRQMRAGADANKIMQHEQYTQQQLNDNNNENDDDDDEDNIGETQLQMEEETKEEKKTEEMYTHPIATLTVDSKGDKVWIHRKGAAPSDGGCVVIPGSRGSHSYICKPLDPTSHSGYSLAHGAGRKLMRSEAIKKMSKWYPNANVLCRTEKFASHVICEDKNLLYEESPHAYKNIALVIQDLVQHNLIAVIATLKPIITYKTKGKPHQNASKKQHHKEKYHRDLLDD